MFVGLSRKFWEHFQEIWRIFWLWENFGRYFKKYVGKLKTIFKKFLGTFEETFSNSIRKFRVNFVKISSDEKKNLEKGWHFGNIIWILFGKIFYEILRKPWINIWAN